MTEVWRRAAATLADDLRRVFGDRLQSVVAYGAVIDGDRDAAVTCLALVDSLTMPDLAACAARLSGWERAGLATPLVLPVGEFRRSLDTFPLEYGEIMRAHARVYGDDPFQGMTIATDDLRRACETQIASHLVHLREEYIESRGRPAAVARLVTASAPAFVAVLRNLARLTGADQSQRIEATRAGARAGGVPDAIVDEMLSLEQPDAVPTSDPARLFPAYLSAVERLAQAVDAWRRA
jgi:hypothetical protein